MSNEKKVWMVTGSSRGIGLEIVRAALEAGHQIVATARRPEQITAALGQQFGEDRLLALAVDLTQEGNAEAAVAAATARFGRIDVLVNNAGYGQIGWFENTSPMQIRRQFETNVFGTMEMTRAVLPIMRQQRSGHVFTFSSIAGFTAFAGSSVYSASKFALEGWMEGLSKEVQPFGIAATLVQPGFFRTDFLESNSINYGDRNVADYAEASAAFKAWHDDQNHQQQGDPQKLAALVIQLAEDKNPPLHLAAGSDALELAVSVATARRDSAQGLAELSRSTDFS